ncbi:MAG TPA: copper resistance CopC family protein [Actinomycetota bacterium]|nr:copper resistance CopC family protein [Actinomycetota bacterium]
MRSLPVILLFALAGVVAVPSIAMAHSELESTDPADNAHLQKVPPRIALEMSEEPGQGSFIKATDGCGDSVPGETSEDGATLSFAPSGGSTGKWSVRYKAISAEDGHVTHGTLSFTVAGKPDCSKDGGGDDQIAGGKGTRVTNDDDGSSFPIVPVIIGAAIVIVAAVILRRSSAT